MDYITDEVEILLRMMSILKFSKDRLVCLRYKRLPKGRELKRRFVS
jgi:hypothetical protein